MTGLTHYWNCCHIAHGNLKPENILVDKEGNLKIDKFGLTALLTLTALKGEEVSIGTPAFMAPELITGCATPNDLSDIYALGMTLSCLLTGLQSAAREPEQNENHMQATMPTRIPMSLEMGKLISHMTATCPEDRFPSWEAVREAIKGYEQSHAIKPDQNKKTQTIKIPICEKNITRIFGATNSPASPRVIKADEVSKISTHIIPVTTGKTPKLKTPISDPTVKADKKWIVQKISGLWIMAAASFLVLVAVIVMWYLCSTKGGDVQKPLPSRITKAYSKNMVLVKHNGWNTLTSDIERLSKLSQQMQDHVQQAPLPSPSLSIQPQKSAKKENMSNRVQDVPSTSETDDVLYVTAPESRTDDPDALYKYGLCLLNGTGVQKNETEAFNLFM